MPSPTASGAASDTAAAVASLPIARFFTSSVATPPSAVWTILQRDEGAIVHGAQRLFEQITATRQSPLRAVGDAQADGDRSGRHGASDKLWAVVAIVATRLSADLEALRERRGGPRTTTTTTIGRKRKATGDSASDDDDVDDDDDDDDEEEADDDDAEDPTPAAASSANGNAVDGDTGTRNGASPRPRRRRCAWHLVEFLVEANVSLTALLQQMTSLFDRLLLDPELLGVTTQLKEEFTVATVLFEKYRVMWKKFALHQDQPQDAERTEQLFRVGWLLFVTIRRRWPQGERGLGHLYYLLLSVLRLVIGQVAPRSLEAEVAATLSALGATKPRPSVNIEDEKLLEILCSSPKVDSQEVLAASEFALHCMDHMARREGLVKVPDDVDVSSDLAIVHGILHPSVLRHNASRLFEHYADEYLTLCGNFDERVYLNEQSRQAILGPRPPSPPSNSGSGSNSASTNGDLPHHHSYTFGNPPPLPSRATDRTPANSMSSPVHNRPAPRTPSRRDADSTAVAPPPSPFTVQAWQWHGASPPPTLTFNLPRGLNTPVARSLSSLQQSPLVAQTPVTAAVETSNWIRDTLSNCQTIVSPQLKSFFKQCTADPADRIAQTLRSLSDKLMTGRPRGIAPPPSLGAPISALQSGLPGSEYSEVDGSLKRTKNLAVALFYQVLEALLRTECERLRTFNFTTLLNNETFISSLFACSLEVVLKAHSLITLSFPFLLDTLGVNAFDFGKVIESFVKHVPKLPSALKRHMRDLEQVILDSLAWRSDSGLFAVLSAAPPPAQSTPCLSPNSQDADEKSSRPSTPTNTAATPVASNPPAAPRATILQLFFRKVLSLAASRIFRLGNMLELDAKYLNQVWTAIKECLSTHHHLLKDRHLDQIVLCSIYGVCKVNHVQPEVTFKKVIDCYKKLQAPQWSNGHASAAAHAAFASSSLQRNSHDIIREIRLDDRNTTGDIIKFYNRCYIPTMKVFLLQFQAQERQVAAAEAAVANASGRDGNHIVTPSTSDSAIVAEAAACAVEKVMQSYAPPRTPVRRPNPRVGMTSPPFGSPTRSLPLFTSAEVESLPVSVHQTSPKRVLTSNIYMSPLQNSRLHQHRTQLTPRSHALYAFGESPARDLALINRAVNTSSLRTAPPPPLMPLDSSEDTASGSNSNHTTPTNKRRRV